MKRESIFNGVMATPITPFDQNGKVYEEGITKLVEFIKKGGINCLYCLGTYGGFALMDKYERMRAAEVFTSECKKHDIKLILNISAPSTREAIEIARHAHKNRVDAISSLVPYYYSGAGYKEQNYIDYFKSLISSVDLPVYYYNNPRTTGYSITIGLFEKLLDVGLQGMKEGTGNISLWMSLMEKASNKKTVFDLIPGQVKTMVMGLIYGAKCVMSGPSVFFPEINQEFYQAFLNGNIQKVAELHKKILKVSKIQGSRGMKYEGCYGILKLRGVDVGKPRHPWRDLSEEDLKAIEKDLKEIGLL